MRRALLVMAIILAGCGERVAVVDPHTQVSLSGNWNDADGTAVADKLVPECLGGAWLDDFARAQNRPPVVRIAHVRARLQEIDDEIDTEIITDDVEKAFIASGKVRAVASRAEAAAAQGARDTRREMRQEAAAGQRPAERQELAADFVLAGSIVTQDDEVLDRGFPSGTFRRVKYYQVTLALTDLASNQVVWTGTARRKKLVEQSTLGW